jgi:2-oxoacid:acceptor oxidoreductase gamma subunit (pyruvate/2-ketoisovalerate family)
VIASKVLAMAVFREGKWVQSFPAFGVERRGAPVTAFTRIDDKRIDLRCEIYEPDLLIVLDPTLMTAVDITQGLKTGGFILINSDRSPEEMKHLGPYRVATVDANAIALAHGLGSPAQPIVNTAILGAFSRATGMVSLESVIEAVKESVPLETEANVAATKEAYERVEVGA